MREVRIHRPLTSANPMEEVMIDHPSLAWTSVTTNAAQGKQSILLWCKGTPKDLAGLKQRYIADPPPKLEHIQVVRERRGSLLLYEVETSGQDPTDISIWIQEILGPETVMRLSKSAEGVTWDLLTCKEDRVEPFLEKLDDVRQVLESRVEDRVPWYELVRFTSSAEPVQVPETGLLDPDERTLLQAALRLGYFDQPKACTLAELADHVGKPRSTVHVHLAQARRKALAAYLGRS